MSVRSIVCQSPCGTRWIDFVRIAPVDAGRVDPPVEDPQPTLPKASRSRKPPATRPRPEPTTKKANNTRQKKGKAVVPSEPEPEPKPKPPQTAATTVPRNRARRDKVGVDRAPAADPSTSNTREKVLPPPRQGTRFSARLRGQGLGTVREPTLAVPETRRKKRGRKLDDEPADEQTNTELPNKRIKSAGTQLDPPAQPEGATAVDNQINVPLQAEDTASTVDNPQVDLSPGKTVAANDLEQPAEVADEEDGEFRPIDDGYIRRFYLRKENGRVSICLGLFPRESLDQSSEE